MKQIHAWIRDPNNNLFKGMSKKSALFQLFCENPDDCDLYKINNSCLHCGAMTYCKFGRKKETQGPTRRSGQFYSTLKKWRENNEQYLKSLTNIGACNRIFYTNGQYYLPYSHMVKGLHDFAPLADHWVNKEDMTGELLVRICEAHPRGFMGGEIRSYQKEVVPKFIHDLKTHYPELFALLPDEQKTRLETISHVGRKADITTCPPCEFDIYSDNWMWDGEYLTGSNMSFQPIPGKCEIRIKPKKSTPVEITDDKQVSSETIFLD